ncbi:hypothetical protein K4R33_11995 [Staphylococcus epidermidis]|nr:hypothetical protein [Staphylococcus epidermidis]
MIIPESAVKNEEISNFLLVVRRCDCDLKKAVIRLNLNDHYEFKNVDEFIDKFYAVLQFIDGERLKRIKEVYGKELSVIDGYKQ